MYDLDKLWYHNQAARQHRYPYEDKQYDYQHIYKRPNEHLSSTQSTLACMTRLGDTLYAIDKFGVKGHSYVNDEMYNWLLNDNGWNVPRCQQIATMLYAQGTLSNILPSNRNDLSNFYTDEQLSSNGIFPTSALLGIKYNTIYEIPGSIKQDYTKGELIANTFKAKNQYNAQWTMEHDNAYVLKNARNYSEIHSCGGTLWLKYKTSQDYKSSNDETKVYPSYCIQKTAVAQSPTPQAALPQVEVITRINRGVETPQHKTSLYSLSLKTTLLDKIVPVEALDKKTVWLDADDKIAIMTGNEAVKSVEAVVQIKQSAIDKFKRTLKAEIENCMRKIAENIAPANSQLFNVKVEG